MHGMEENEQFCPQRASIPSVHSVQSVVKKSCIELSSSSFGAARALTGMGLAT